MFLLTGVLAWVAVQGQEGSMAELLRKQYEEASLQYAKEPDNVAVLMEMARLVSNTECAQYSLTQAADYLGKAEEIYTARALDKGRYNEMQKLIRKGITLPVIRQCRSDVESQAVLYVRQHVPEMGKAEIDAFKRSFPGNDEIMKRLNAKEVADRYEAVCQENTLQGYYDYLKTRPNSVLADSVEKRMSLLAQDYFSTLRTEREVDSVAALFAQSPAVQNAAMKHKSRLAYRAASKTNTVEAFSLYLERYPRGDEYVAALNHLNTLRSNQYGLLSTPEQLATFAQTYSDSPLADSALAKLRKMVKEDHNVDAVEVYLSRFPLDEYYSSVYKEYYSWFAAEGNRLPIESFAQDHPDYPFGMAVRSDLERGAMIDSFNLMKPFVEADLDTMTVCIHRLTGRRIAFVALQRVLQNLIVKKDWNGALQRMKKYELSFGNVTREEYEELAAILGGSGKSSTTMEYSAKNMLQQVPHPDGVRIYYNRAMAYGNDVAYAVRIDAKHGWREMGAVRVDGATGEVSLFSFYDGGSRALVGVNDDIWSAELVNDSVWVLKERFKSPVNTAYIETDAMMLADGSGMLLASDRPGGYNVQESGDYYHGDTAWATDLYYIPYRDGRWGEAVNLGRAVNTPYCERYPLLSRNMKTMYYVTDARGLGYGDIYCVTRADVDDWNHWSKPVNMGRGVNTAFAEGGLSFAQGERRVVYTTMSPQGRTQGCHGFATKHDTASVHKSVQVDLSQTTGMLRSVELVEVWRQHVAQRWSGSEIDSMIQFEVYKDKEYALVPQSGWVYIPTLWIGKDEKGIATMTTYTSQQLYDLEQPLPLRLVQFFGNTASLLPMGKKELDGVVAYLHQHEKSSVELRVHVEGNDSRESYDLSMQRANAVRNYMIEQGIDDTRVRISAYGNIRYRSSGVSGGVEVRFF